MQREFFTVLVIGDNPDEKIKKYSQSTEVEPYILHKRENAEEHRKIKIDLIKEYQKTSQDGIYDEYLKNIEAMSEDEYFASITKGCTYDDNGDAYTTKNPRGYYKNERSPQKALDVTGEESGFSNPFYLKKGSISYTDKKGEIDWQRMHKHNTILYEYAWKMIVDGSEPKDDMQKTIYEHMKNRRGYFDNFKDMEEYVNYSTSFWTYGIINNDRYMDIDTVGSTDKEWVNNFYDSFIKDLPDDTLLTLYEVQRGR